MTAAASLRKGWCPGALRPMPAKDGFLVRLRISGGALSAVAMRRLAQAGRDHGNGLFDLSSRANLQMRGVSERSLPLLRKMLDDLGLLDQDAEAEAIRNVLASPLAGLDAPIDVRSIARSLEAALVRETELHGLPGKFGFLIDDGGALSLAHVPADVRFDYSAERDAFAVRTGGSAREAAFLCDCEPRDVVDIALRLARAFMRLGLSMREPPRRMRELVAECGPASIAKAAGLSLAPAPEPEPLAEPCPIGLIRLEQETYSFGVGAAFGRLDAAMLETIADAAAIFGQDEIRLTPWRAILLPFVDAGRDKALRAHFAAENFIIDAADPRLAVAACGGAPACERGSTPTHADALSLASIARRLQETGVALHVSGCVKGCARQAATAYTLVANAGRYDLIQDGTAQDASPMQGLTLAQAQSVLEAIALKKELARELEFS
ncbi:precorrin-3B synthase [Methylocapsa polymorpha]|uniref:Precorrin-3B synthase n=1 Tax=Methylocapsa polymorpha TaxID=3080828 RepID=A0ABZ0HWU4_9HYPH|nr:precorrin-3B synthase [Methylocapsa sp. RX1]